MECHCVASSMSVFVDAKNAVMKASANSQKVAAGISERSVNLPYM